MSEEELIYAMKYTRAYNECQNEMIENNKKETRLEDIVKRIKAYA